MTRQARRGVAALVALPLAIAIALPALGNERKARKAPTAQLAAADQSRPAFPAPPAGPSTDAVFAQTLSDLGERPLQQTLRSLDATLQLAPNFRLGHVVKGDLLMARSGKPVAFAALAATNPEAASLQEEARARLQRHLAGPPKDHLPLPILQLAPGQPHAVLVDTSAQRLYVFANDDGTPRYVTDFYVSVGKNGIDKLREGDQKTPLGVYRVVEAKNRLPDLYGPGAFPIDYPNAWDRLHRRDGYGIWLHGTPSETYSRPPRATDGCVALSNPDLLRLARYVDVGRTPVVIAEGVAWAPPERWQASRQDLLAALERWRADWESLDTDRYLANYAASFRTESRDLAAFAAQKRKVNAGKSWIKLSLSDVSVLGHSNGEDLAVVTFAQDYRSSNLSNRIVKRQYWSRAGGTWRIVFETSGA